ncbi:DOMON domain containing protein [Acanthamoeba castellanii str. Neff]|uniref:DOMON domain containing protein n=1 Tax=Acanthamoeba castellanii (strain ATCC 30010 / Neff) TaxID=1257118 RepID=L8H9L7_ACACF|nr:DOMON domain containing protein [Acanthamoeba castellanii str. Neff]ELR21885.1 DOMON domain containing protein [Acanthamoeba castellanii str. Neff]
MHNREGGFLALAGLACLFVLCLHLPLVSAGSFTLWGESDFDSCRLLVGTVSEVEYDYRLYWTVNSTAGTIVIGLAAKANNSGSRIHAASQAPGWMGLGLSSNGNMNSGGTSDDASDIWVGWVGGAVGACADGCVADYTASARSQPVLDSTGNLESLGFGQVDGYTWLKYRRLLVSTDSADRAITPDEPQWVIHALGPGLPRSFTNFAPEGGTRKHMNQTNAADLVQFGEHQWTCEPTTPVANASNQTSTGSYRNPADTWRVSWAVIESGTEVEFNISARTSSWWALGINTDDLMIGADIIWKANAHETPPADASQDVELVSGDFVDGWSTCRVRRPIDTGDSTQDHVIRNSSMNLLWAYGASLAKRSCTGFCQHNSDARGLASVNFFTGSATEVKQTDDRRKAHGILMLFAWGLLAVAGAFISRYCKTPQGKWVLYGYVWVHLHGFLGILTFAINLIAFALIVDWVSDRGISHFKGAHEIIGIIMFICSFFLPIFGVVGELFLKKYHDPNWVGYLIGTAHGWFGKALVLLGLVEIYLGLALYCVPTYTMVTYGVAVGSMIALFLVHEVLRWFAPWGSWLGGPGFTYQRVDDDNGSTEMKDFSPENKIPWMNKRAPVQPPLVVKICLWLLQVGLAVVIIGLWVATAVGIGDKDISRTDSFESSCTIGTKFQ